MTPRRPPEVPGPGRVPAPAAPEARPAPRVGIIGARRRRQGLGPFVARFLAARGADVSCFATTGAASRDTALAQLRELAGLTPRGYDDPAAMLASEELDAVAVLTPPETHRRWLEAALEAGLHVLAEKPLLWGGDDDLAAAGRLIEGFSARHLLLHENCQWPYTVAAYRALVPETGEAPPRRFEMEMEPARRGREMIGDALPHPISLLQDLAPARRARLEDVRYSSRAGDAEALQVAFRWMADAGPVDVAVRLRRGLAVPRAAAWGVDGRLARRLVRTSDYAQFLACGNRVIDVPDPMAALIGDFVDAVAGALADPGADRPAEIHRMTLVRERMSAIDQLVRAHRGDA